MKKECNVVMLATDNGNLVINKSDRLLISDSDNISKLTHKKYGNTLFDLYITSDEEISDGDYVYGWNEIIIWNSQEQHTVSPTGYKKIIATTDTSLDLPQIPQSFIDTFIEEYNKGNVIDKVLVEYECDHNEMPDRIIDVLKINPDNTINISLIEDYKLNFNQLMGIFDQGFKYCKSFEFDIIKIGPVEYLQKWIEENLK